MARTRQERKNDFDEFYNSAKDIFIAFRNQFDLGMQTEEVIKIKKLDSDFWDEMQDM